MTNILLNAMMLELLRSGGKLSVCTITEATVDVDGAVSRLDLNHKAARLLVVSAVLTAARLNGQSVENF
jgi:hypothetical protein